MVQRVEAWGNVLEFPDGMADADIASAIQKNEANLNPDASTFTKARSAVSGGIDAGLSMLAPKRSIADQAQEQSASTAGLAAPQVKGAPVRRDFYNRMVENPVENSAPGIVSRVRDAAANDTKAQRGKQAVASAIASPEQEEGIGFLGTLKEGAKGTARNIGATVDTLQGDAGDVVSASQDAASAEKDPALSALLADIEQRKKTLGEDPGWLDSIGTVGKAALLNPRGAGLLLAEQLPNSAAALAAGGAGAAAGSLFGPVGTIAGGISGLFAANAALETGGKAIEAATDGTFSPEEQSRVLKEGAIKGGVITGVDAATLGLTNFIMGTTARAVERATVKTLMDKGVDVTNKAAVLAATKNPAIAASVKSAQALAQTASTTLGQRLARVGGATGLETVGEGAGEYLGEFAATGKADKVEAVIEAFSSLGQSAGEIAFTAARNKARLTTITGKPVEDLSDSVLKYTANRGGERAKAAAQAELNRRAATYSDEQLTAASEHAQSRIQEITTKLNGTEDRVVTGPDDKPMTIRGEQKGFVSPDEKAELEFLLKNQSDPAKIARAYGLEPGVTNDAEETTSEAVDRIISTGKDKAQEIRDSLTNPAENSALLDEDSDHIGDANKVVEGEIDHIPDVTKMVDESQQAAPDTPTPEPVETLNAQFNALINGDKPSMLLTPGEPMPHTLPDGVRAAEIPGRGTLLYRDGATLQAALNGQMGTALGYGIDEKPVGAGQVVTARDQNGTVIQDVATDGNPRVEQAAAAVAGPGGSVETRPVEQAMDERAANSPEIEGIRTQVVLPETSAAAGKITVSDESRKLAEVTKKALKSQQSYEQAKAAADDAWERNKRAGVALDKFPKGPMGLTPDEVKGTPEWKAAKKESDEAHAASQEANSFLLKNFPKEVRADRDAVRAAKVAGEKSPAGNESVAKEVSAVQSEAVHPVRPLVESLIKRRAAAKQGGKDLSNAIARAKEMMEGKREPSTVENRWFRLQAKAFERADGESANILRQIAEVVKPAKVLETQAGSTSFERYAALGNKIGTAEQALADAEELTGIRLGLPLKRTKLREDVPARFILDSRTIEVSENWKMPRSEAAQYLAEEILHAVDSLNSGRTLSASSKRLDLKTGDIAQEAIKHFDNNGAYWTFLRYPIAFDELSDSVKKAELFARLGVLYFGEPARMQRYLPTAYGAFNEIFKFSINPVTAEISRSLWSFTGGSGTVGVKHRASGRAAQGDGGSLGDGQEAELERLRAAVRRHFKASPGGGKVSFGRVDTRSFKTRLQAYKEKQRTGADSVSDSKPASALSNSAIKDVIAALDSENIEWQGKSVEETHALIHTFVTTLHNKLPSIKNAKYDFSRGEFLNRLGVPLNRAAFQRIAGSGVGREGRAGEATMRRGILIQSLISGQGGSRSGILEQVLNRSSTLVRRGKLEGIFSRHKAKSESKQATPPGGLSVSAVEKLIAPLQAEGFKKINIAASENDLPQTAKEQIKSRNAQGVRGVYLPKTDEIWLVAGRLNDASETIMVSMHEARHRGLRKLFGPGISPIMRQIYATNKRVRDAADAMMKSTKGVSKEEATEEVLADMSINRTAHLLNGWKKLVRFIQQWLVDHGINLTFSDAMVETLVAGAEVAGMAEKDVSLFDDKQAGAYSEASEGTVFTPQTDTPAFKKWFSKSKVVDADGKPLIAYHGSGKDIKKFRTHIGAGGELGAGSYFTDSRDEANSYSEGADNPSGEYQPGANVIPVYLAIKNPFVSTDVEYITTRANLIKRGYDGVIDKGGSRNQYVAFYPEQIKSAIGNNGEFDEANPDIRFSRSGQGNLNLQGGQAGNSASWDAPEPSKIDDLIYKLQNKHVDLKRVMEAVRNTGSQLADKWNTYLQEELFHGRAAKRTQDFVNKELKPILAGMKLRGLTVDELDKYLHARHAEEANDLIAQRDPNMPDGGSGMTTQEAKDYLANLPAEKKRKLEQVAAKVDAVIATTRDLYVSYGLIDKDTADSWESMFQYYVPLMREDHDGGMGIGQGFSIKGKEVKHRTGSKRKVVDILANIALQRERAIVRGEKNRVAVSLAGLAKLNPNPDFWTFETPPQRHYNEDTGLVEERTDPRYKDRENVVVAKIKDSNGKVQERAVIFEKSNDRAMRMAQALKNLDAIQLEGLLGISAKITRYFAAINTQYNPVFGIVNLTRDLQASLINLSSTPIAGHKAQVLKNVLPAIRAIYSSTRGDRKGKQAASPMAVLWDEMQREGGMTGYRDLFKTSEDRANAIKRELDPTAWMNSGLGKIFTAGGALKVPLAIAQKRAGWLFDWLSDYNQTLEGAMRLSVYKTAIDNGVSKQQAASLAKNISVNFNRKGQSGQQAGALYAFFNAAMQGTARIGETMTTMEKGDIKTFRFNRAGKRIIAGGITLGAMQALALAAAGFDDDEPPEFVRERSLILPIGDKKYITVPMPLGFHAIPNIGRISTEFALGGFKDPAKHTARLLAVFAEAFNPIGSAGLSIQTIAPTAIDPFVALSENKDWTGKPIAKEDFNKLSPTPGFSRNKDTASDPAKWIAEAINTLSGGNKYVPGIASPTADQIDYLFGQVTGGVGREAGKAQQSISATLSGEELPPHKVPLVGRFYGDSSGQSSQGNAFYSNLKRINEVEAELKGRRKDRLPLDEFKSENPEHRLAVRANLIERLVSKQRKLKSELIEKDAPKEQVKAIDERITKLMAGFNQRVKELKQGQQAAH